jgi:prophage tail gpP-like protein
VADVQDIAELLLNGKTFSGFSRVSIGASIEQAVRQATLELTWQPDDKRPVRFNCPPGSSVEVLIHDQTGTGRTDRVITGFAEALSPGHDPDGWRFAVEVESKTTDVVLSDPVDVGPVFQRMTRLQIVKAICAPHGISVVLGPGVVDTEILSSFKLETGESAFAAIERVSRAAAWLITDNPEGELVLTRAGVSRAQTALILSDNIISLSGRIDSSQRYSEYVCRGQRAGDDLDNGETVSAIEGSALDPWQTRVRRLSVDEDRATTPAAALSRAKWEAAQRAGRSVSLTYTVRGWRQRPGGDLWAPNLLVSVDDWWTGIDGELLIVGVGFDLDAHGERTTITVSPKEGYEKELPVQASRRPARPKKRAGSASGYLGRFAAAIGIDVAEYVASVRGNLGSKAAPPSSSGDTE